MPPSLRQITSNGYLKKDNLNKRKYCIAVVKEKEILKIETFFSPKYKKSKFYVVKKKVLFLCRANKKRPKIRQKAYFWSFFDRSKGVSLCDENCRFASSSKTISAKLPADSIPITPN